MDFIVCVPEGIGKRNFSMYGHCRRTEEERDPEQKMAGIPGLECCPDLETLRDSPSISNSNYQATIGLQMMVNRSVLIPKSMFFIDFWYLIIYPKTLIYKWSHFNSLPLGKYFVNTRLFRLLSLISDSVF